jgi:DNA-binding LacI/PurR family transcriptional regulator
MNSAFNKLLLVFDNSPQSKIALRHACDVASKSESSITAIFTKGSGADARKFIEDFTSSKGIGLTITDEDGNVAKKVLKLQKAEQFDILIFAITSSVNSKKAYSIVKKSRCPAITINEGAKDIGFEDIVLPLADYQSTRQKARHAVLLAKAFQSTVHIFGTTKSSKAKSHTRVNSYIRQTERFLAERGVRHTVDSKYGSHVPTSCIEYGQSVNAGLILIMTDSESSGFFGTTYAQQLITSSPIPIMSVNSKETQKLGASGY